MRINPSAKLDRLIHRIEIINKSLYQLSPMNRNQLKRYLDPHEVKNMGQLNDDPDVYGEKFRVYYKTKFLTKEYKLPVADIYFYHDKGYKNKREYLWQDSHVEQELSFLEKLAMNSMRVSLKRQLKKRSLV